VKSLAGFRVALILSVCLCLAQPALAGSVALSPSNLSFGSQVVGVPSATRNVTLTNGLTKALTITSYTITLPDYTQTNTCPVSPATLASGASCVITVTFTPTTAGSRTGTLYVNDSAGGSPQKLTLNGTGVAAVTATPTSLTFASLVIGKKSASKTVTIKNNQSIGLSITGIASNLSDFTDTTTCPQPPNTLAAGGTCTVSVYFTPAAAGTRTGTLTITDDANVNPTVALTGTGLYPAAVSPSSLTFAGQAVGTTSGPQTVTLTNNQTSSLTITSITSNLTDFPITYTCPISPSKLAAGASCTASVSFAPTAQGSRTGTLSFNDTASNSPQTVSLSGTGNPPALDSIAVTPSAPSIAAGTTQQFKATGTYSDGSTQDITSSVAWTSSNTAAATVNSGGLATGVAFGSSQITATSGTISGSSTLAVTPAVLQTITVTPAIPSLAAGMTQQFTATGTYSDGSTQNLTTSVTWSSSSVPAATISNAAGSQGLATAVATGTTLITAASGIISGSTTLTVTPAALESIAVTPANPTLATGATQQFTATGTYSDGSTQNLTSSVTWSTDAPSVATISSSGLATAVMSGNANISATSGNVSGSTALTVSPAVLQSITVTPAMVSVPAGLTQQFTATGNYSDGTTQDLTQTGYWTSSSAGAATVSNAAGSQGLASALATGGTTISVTSGTVTGSAQLTVNPASLQSIAIAPQNPSIAFGTTQQFTATGTYSDGTTQDVTTSVTWSSAAATVAVISNSAGSQGLATSAGQGSTNITASVNTVSSSTTLTVNPPALVSLSVTPTNPSVVSGASEQFSATGTYTDGSTQNLTTSSAWTSSAPGTASVSSTGLATGLQTGSAVISATSGGISGSSTLTVQAPAGTVTVTPASPSLGLGSNMQFAATVTGLSGGVSWQVNGIAGGTAALGTIDSTGFYLAPTAFPSSSVTVTALASDNMTSGSAAVTLTSPDPMGTVSSYTTIACGNRKMAGTCYQLNLSCQGVPNISGYLVVSNPTSPMVGSVLFFTGGGGTTLYESAYTYGTTTMNTVLSANYQVVQVTYGSPYIGNQPDGWLTGSTAGGGPRKAACNIATVAKWVHDNLSDTTKPFCGTGNSAGGQALAYATVFYGLDSTFTMIEPTAGPPFAHLDWGCDSSQPKVYSSCANLNVGYSIGVTNAQNFIDPSYGDSRCSSDISAKSTANDAQFLSDSLLAPGAKTNFATYVRILFGGQDTSSGQNHATSWLNTVTSSYSTSCITDAQHDMPSTLDAAQQIGTDMLTYCVAPTH
jgi:uncharacterized protein YjdB